MKTLTAAVVCLALSSGAFSQDTAPKQAERRSDQSAETSRTPAANPADVGSLNAILTALYDVISGPAGKKRDWDRMRSLFIPGARLIPSGKRANGEIGHTVLDVDGYISRSGPYLEKEGFFEREIARRVEQWGNIAHVFSTYDSRRKPEDEKPFARGINSIQLLNDGKRWWIVTIYWQAESQDNPLPSRYLKSEGGNQ